MEWLTFFELSIPPDDPFVISFIERKRRKDVSSPVSRLCTVESEKGGGCENSGPLFNEGLLILQLIGCFILHQI